MDIFDTEVLKFIASFFLAFEKRIIVGIVEDCDKTKD